MTRKIAIILGGSRGIGRAVALEFARKGMLVVIGHLRNELAANETAKQIVRLGGKALLFRLNARNQDEIDDMFNKVGAQCGRLDVLVHAVGLSVFKPLTELSPTQITHIFDINARSFILCAQRSSKLMKHGGAMVAISSIGGQRFVSDYGGLGIAKAALEAAVRYLAIELASKGIRVNAVSGGPVDTIGITAIPNYKQRKRAAISSAPTKRVGAVTDITNVVSFLSSEKSAWINGQVVVADGGLSLLVPGL